MKDFKIKSSLLVGALVMMLCYNLLCLKELYEGISAQTRSLSSSRFAMLISTKCLTEPPNTLK